MGKGIFTFYRLLYVFTKYSLKLQVNYRSEWDEMLPDFGISKNCVNASVALKNIYIRFLDRYEKVHFLGEDTERVDDLDEDSRHKKWSSKNFCSVPLSYNYAQHNIHGN